VAVILMIFMRINCPNFISDLIKIHNLTFKDAQVNFNDTQSV